MDAKNQTSISLIDQARIKSYAYGSIDDPCQVVHLFFANKNIQAHLDALKLWHKAAFRKKNYHGKHTASIILQEHKMVSNLISAIWIILHQKTSANLFKAGVENEKSNFSSIYLSAAELNNPYLMFQNFYQDITLEQYHEFLYDWLNKSLTTCTLVESIKTTKLIYKNLRKLIICCWLIKENLPPTLTENNQSPKQENQITEQFKNFMDAVPAQRLNMGLRKILIDYLFYNIDGLPINFEDTLNDFSLLTNFLDQIQKNETNHIC